MGRKYWAVGSTWTEKNIEKKDDFFNEGEWVDGYGFNGDTKYRKVLKQVKIGDVLVLKSSSTKGAKHNISFTRVKAVGIVEDIVDWFRFKVNWINKEEKIFDNISYRQTICKMLKYAVYDYAKAIVEPSSEETAAESYVDDYVNLLMANHNIILHGAPGTGKTFTAKAIAKELGASDDEVGFVQFHPSYDYADFVEGLRPEKSNDGNIGFVRTDGVFKEFCKKALQNSIDSQKNEEALNKERSTEELLQDFLDEAEENEYHIKTGNRFSIDTSNEKKIHVIIPDNPTSNSLNISRRELLKLLASEERFSTYSKSYRELLGRRNRKQEDSYILSILQEIYKRNEHRTEDVEYEKVEKKNYVFIIDEINRGDLSKIFGELFFSIDPGYRGANGRVKTQYQNLVEDDDEFAEGFFIPENVYIIGTMNDIDRSVESMDFAMRRRFAFCEVTAQESQAMLSEIADDDVRAEAIAKMDALNAVIDATEGLGTAYQIGAAYFLKLKENEGDYEALWENNLRGLLGEYLRGMPEAAEIMANMAEAYHNAGVTAEDEEEEGYEPDEVPDKEPDETTTNATEP